MKVLLPGVSMIVRFLGCKRACLGCGNLFLFGVYLLLCKPCSVWAGSIWHFSMFCGSSQTSTGWQWNVFFPCLWDFNSYQELKIIRGMFCLSFFLRFIYFCENLVLWEQGLLCFHCVTGHSQGRGWLTKESQFWRYKIPHRTLAPNGSHIWLDSLKWESHLTWLSIDSQGTGVTIWLNAMLCCQQ